MTPTLSCIIPTYGRATLARTLDSIAPQILPGDEVLVIADSASPHYAPDLLRAICGAYPFVRLVAYGDEPSNFGHPQIDYGVTQARGDWLTFQDDDDQYTPDAFATIRATIASLDRPRPLLFRFLSRFGVVYWDREQRDTWDRERRLLEGHIGGHCLVCPSIPEKVGKRGRRYAGDFDQLRETVELWQPVDPLWCEDVIAVARPKE